MHADWLLPACLLLLLLLLQARLKELAQDLLGPDRWRPAWGDGSPWAPTVMGLAKRRLLGSTVLPVMAQANLSIAGQVSRGAGLMFWMFVRVIMGCIDCRIVFQ
jgi:hypothetical protein